MKPDLLLKRSWHRMRQTPNLNRQKIGRQALALGIGFLGVQLFLAASMPLPWMLGPMVACAIVSFLGAPISNPRLLRSLMVPIIGVSLGSAFIPETLAALGSIAFAFLILMIAMFLAAFVCYQLYRRIGGLEPSSALFSAMPGGLAEMVVLSESLGKDSTSVALLQACRIFFVVMIIPLWFQFTQNLTYVSGSVPMSIHVTETSWIDIATIGLLAAAGAWGGKKLNLPAAVLVGPLLLSAVLHMSAVTTVPPVSEFVSIAQLVLGTSVGSRFNLVSGRQAAYLVGLGLIGTLVMIGFAGAAVLIAAETTELPLSQLLLSFAPGGIAEMALMSLALGVDVTIVVSAQVARIAVIVITARMLLRLVR